MIQILTNRRYIFLAALNVALAGSLSAQFATSNALEAQAYGAVVNQGHTALSSASDFALNNLSGVSGFYGGYAYDNVETDPTGPDRAFDTDSTQHGMNVGYVHHFDKMVAGLSLSYFDSETEANYADAGNVGIVELDGDGWIVSAGVADTWDQLTLSIVGGFGQQSLDGSRRSTSNLTLGKSDSSFDLDLYYLTIDAHYEIALSERASVAPFLQLNYLNVSSDSFTESGGADSGQADSIERDWITSELGLRSSLNVSDALTASLVLSWEYDFDNSKTDIAGDDNGGTFGGLGVPDVGENRFKATIGLDYLLSENWVLSADVSLATGDDYDAIGAGVFLGYSF
jgi:outer membrane autotransporter protein